MAFKGSHKEILSAEQVIGRLKNGRAVEQWLTHTDTSSYRSIQWLRIDPEKDGRFSVTVFEVFDDGGPGALDIFSFEPVDPDAAHGKSTLLDSPEEAIQFAVGEKGAGPEKFVGSGLIQDLYASFIREHGEAPKG